MDFDPPSSPRQMPISSLPPSSAPALTATPEGATPRHQQPVTDALAMEPDEPEEAEEDAGGKRRRRPRQTQGDVPMVKDAVGESVAESFETFLKTYVHLLLMSIVL